MSIINTYHEVVIDRFILDLSKDEKTALCSHLPVDLLEKLKKKNLEFFEFFINMPEDLVKRIFSQLSDYQAFICHAVCKRFFKNEVIAGARNALANSIAQEFYRHKKKNFNHLTPELKQAVRVLSSKGYYPRGVDAQQFPNIETIIVHIPNHFLKGLFSNISEYFSNLKEIQITGPLFATDTEKYTHFPKAIERLTFTCCELTEKEIQKIACSFTSLKSLNINSNTKDDDDVDILPSSGFSQLTPTLEHFSAHHDRIQDVRCLSHLTNLKDLVLSDLLPNQSLTALPTSLTSLCINYECSEPDTLQQLTHLTNLKILGIPFDEQDEEELSTLNLPAWMQSLLDM